MWTLPKILCSMFFCNIESNEKSPPVSKDAVEEMKDVHDIDESHSNGNFNVTFKSNVLLWQSMQELNQVMLLAKCAKRHKVMLIL